jgi:hypothetical protein
LRCRSASIGTAADAPQEGQNRASLGRLSPQPEQTEPRLEPQEAQKRASSLFAEPQLRQTFTARG